MGGLLTTATDLGKYVAFHLSAWPPRDDADAGPVRRASVREMAHLWTPANLTARVVDGTLQASEAGYGFGLRVTADCRFEHIVAHGGGLPGFGSYMAWLPEYGVGMFAMATLTYSGPSEPISQAWDVLLKTGGLQKRELPPTTVQTRDARSHRQLVEAWDDGEAQADRGRELLPRRAVGAAAGGDRGAEEGGRRVHRRRPADAGELAARAVQPDLRERHRRRVLHAGADAAAERCSTSRSRSWRPPRSRMGAPTGAPAGVSCSRVIASCDSVRRDRWTPCSSRGARRCPMRQAQDLEQAHAHLHSSSRRDAAKRRLRGEQNWTRTGSTDAAGRGALSDGADGVPQQGTTATREPLDRSAWVESAAVQRGYVKAGDFAQFGCPPGWMGVEETAAALRGGEVSTTYVGSEPLRADSTVTCVAQREFALPASSTPARARPRTGATSAGTGVAVDH